MTNFHKASSGNGSSGNPYQVATLDNLYWLSQTDSVWTSGHYFIQTANINADSSKSWDGGSGFTTIGNNSNAFKASYNGNNHTISKLYINRASDSYIGLFGLANGASIIKNLGVINVNITGGNIAVGGLAGVSTSVINCYCPGIVNGVNFTGGLVGENNGTISNSNSLAHVSGNDYDGGLVGLNSGTVVNSYSAGRVGSSSFGGGLIGENDNVIIGCYSTATVQCLLNGGGLVGYNFTNSVIRRSYSAGSISGQKEFGGLVGVNTQGTIDSCYSSTDVYFISGSGSGLDLGGLVGHNTNNGTIRLCFSTGTIQANDTYDVSGLVGFLESGKANNCYSKSALYDIGGSNIGGLAGLNQGGINESFAAGSISAGTNHVGEFVGGNGGTIDSSFWNKDSLVTGIGSGTKTGASGKTTSQLQTQSTFTNAGWNSSFWYMDSGVNNGYPYLSWQNHAGSPLPVELITFTAANFGDKVELKWTTATEVNCYGFEVERRIPLRNLTKK